MKKFILILLVCVMLVGCLTCFTSCSRRPVELSQDSDKDIISALCSYLQEPNKVTEVFKDSSLESKIDSVKNGSFQALHVAISPNNYYYICGYYTSDHIENGYCCAAKYTWVKFFNKENIQEYYGEEKFVVAFQINKAKFVRNITSIWAKTPKFEHFLMYTPEFKNGVNIADKIYCNVSYVHFSSKAYEKNTKYILDSSDEANHHLQTLPCEKINGKYYILQETKVGYKERNLESEFGIYYDELMEIMIVDQYSEKQGRKTYHYGLINVNEFGKKILI